jgi:hypothetical protein
VSFSGSRDSWAQQLNGLGLQGELSQQLPPPQVGDLHLGHLPGSQPYSPTTHTKDQYFLSEGEKRVHSLLLECPTSLLGLLLYL